MASRLPVLASETASFPEVLDGSGLLFDPEDRDSIARQMARIAGDPTLRSALAEKSRQRASLFSWHKAAEQTLRVYLELLNRSDEIFQNHNHVAAAISEWHP